MGYRIRDLPTLLSSHVGRRLVLGAALNRMYRPMFALGTAYRCTVGRSTRWVAVAGSFGKTTTTRALLTGLGSKVHLQVGWNSRTFLAYNVMRVGPSERFAVVEVAINGPRQMASNARLVRPHIAVITSIGSEHNRSLGTIEAIRDEKADLLRWLPATGLAVLNCDDPHVRWMASQTKARIVTFGFDESADVNATGYRLDWPGGSRWTLRTRDGNRQVRTRLIGRHMVYPMLACVAVAQAEGLSLDAVISRLETLQPTGSRLQPAELPNGAIVLRDEAKSPVETVDAAFDAVADVPARRRILVMGEISEPMGPKRQIYRRLGERAAGIFDQAILLVDDSFRSFAAGAREKGLSKDVMVHVRSVQEAFEALPGDLGPGDVLLLKGRLTQRMGRIMLAMAGRQVRCALTFCDAKLVRCGECPMLESGWPDKGTRVLVHQREGE